MFFCLPYCVVPGRIAKDILLDDLLNADGDMREIATWTRQSMPTLSRKAGKPSNQTALPANVVQLFAKGNRNMADPPPISA